jgi:hypothetical protein
LPHGFKITTTYSYLQHIYVLNFTTHFITTCNYYDKYLVRGLQKNKAGSILKRGCEMQPIEDLKAEHDAVNMTMKILDSICKQLEKTGEISSPDHLAQLIEFFRTFVDNCHRRKEEALLFPALEEIGVSREGGHWRDTQGTPAGT